MLLTITQYAELQRDANGNIIPVGRKKIATEGFTGAATATALDARTRIIRIATDTAVQIDMSGGTTDSDSELIPANSSEYFAVEGGEELDINTIA